MCSKHKGETQEMKAAIARGCGISSTQNSCEEPGHALDSWELKWVLSKDYSDCTK